MILLKCVASAAISGESPARMETEFLSCDWGTSSFRLRLVSAGKVDAEIRDSNGTKVIFDSGAGPLGFARRLSDRLAEIAAQKSLRPGIPLVISGMASSTIGWKELPYAKIPFSLDGTGLVVERLQWEAPSWLGSTFLVSGAATEAEIMRGEECQIIGLFAAENLVDFRKNALLILPGTHSKHVRIEKDCVVDFQTFMTGELFDVLAKNSVLRATVEAAAPIENHREAFLEGARAAQSRGLEQSLFQARTRAVLHGRAKPENAAFLSGLLIGSELRHLGRDGPPIILASSNSILSRLYETALRETFSLEFHTADSDCAALGHGVILAQQA